MLQAVESHPTFNERTTYPSVHDAAKISEKIGHEEETAYLGREPMQKTRNGVIGAKDSRNVPVLTYQRGAARYPKLLGTRRRI